MKTLVRIGLAWLANVVALLAAEGVEEGLRIEPEWRVLTAGAVFGVVNWAIRPTLKRMAAPFIILTLGIAIFAVNLIAVYLASEISSGFELEDFNAAITVAIFLWIANALLQAGFAIARRRDSNEPASATNARRR